MNKFIAVYTACSLLVLLMVGQAAEHSSLSSREEEHSLNSADEAQSHPDFDHNYDDEVFDEELESEIQLKKMINYVTPLMAIFTDSRKKRAAKAKRSSDYEDLHQHDDIGEEDTSQMVEEGRKRGRRPPLSYKSSQPDRSGYYGDYGSASSYGGGGGYGCCEKKDDLLPILALTALSLLLLYLIAIATTTTTAAGRRRRHLADNDLIDEDSQPEIGIS